jgi:UDP-3-O-[3-hydroxymyristoyl] glucosamine N-acyltransferase
VSFAAAELAAACGGRLAGDPERRLAGVRALAAAGPEDVSYIVNRQGERDAASSKAGLLLARSAAAFPGRAVIEVEDPQIALIAVLKLFHPPRVARPGIHATAIVDATATIDASAEIGPYAVIGAGSTVGAGSILEAHVVVGERCRIGSSVRLHPHVVLYDGVVLGARTEVHSGAVLGSDGFGYAPTKAGILKIPQIGGVTIEEDVEIGANSCVDRAALETTRVGGGTKIDDLVMIGHNCDIGRHGFLCGQVGLAGSTKVGDGVVLAGQVGVAGHLRIGNGARVGAQSGINTDVPDGTDVFGSPHMPYREFMKSHVEFRRLVETARLVRTLAKDRSGSTHGEGPE